MASTSTKSLEQEQLRASLIEKTGIDFVGYRSVEIQESIINLLDSVTSVWIYTAGIPVLASLLVFAGGVFMAWKLSMVVAGLLLCGVALTLVPICGFFSGLFLLAQGVTDDVECLFDASLAIVHTVADDLPKHQAKAAAEGRNVATPAEIMSGVQSLVVIPIVLGVIAVKIPLIGGRISQWVAGMLTQSSQKAVESAEPATAAQLQDIQAYSTYLHAFATKTHANIHTITDITRAWILRPLFVTMLITVVPAVLAMASILLAAFL